MKKILLVGVLLVALMFVTTPIASAVEPPPCGGGPETWALLGPPVVGTLVIKYVGFDGTSNILSFKFKGCCADCFKRCETASCDVIIKFEKPLYNTLPQDIELDDLQNFNVAGWGPKGCYSKRGGEDLVITHILNYELKDKDNDGIYEVYADVVMFYWQCI